MSIEYYYKEQEDQNQNEEEKNVKNVINSQMKYIISIKLKYKNNKNKHN